MAPQRKTLREIMQSPCRTCRYCQPETQSENTPSLWDHKRESHFQKDPDIDPTNFKFLTEDDIDDEITESETIGGTELPTMRQPTLNRAKTESDINKRTSILWPKPTSESKLWKSRLL